MGNIVCGSALKQGSTVQNYLLFEGAIPAGCYDEGGGDGGGGVNGYARFWAEERDRPTPDYYQAPNGILINGYRGLLRRIGGSANRIVNFHNVQDFALATGTKFFWFEANWERNQRTDKPDGSTGAIHAGDWRYLYDMNEVDLFKEGRLESVHFINSGPVWALTRHVNDPHEMTAFVARSRSKAVGAVDASLQNRPANMEHVNLNASPYNFDNREDDHSGQFNRRIQEVNELYQDITAILNADQ